MNSKKLIQTSSPAVLAIILASCGGGTTTDNTSEVGASLAGASASGTSVASNETSNTSVSGRVADGYIQGATVCIDLNESDSCDIDEPSTVTGEGGTYDLDIPVGAEDKPIVADIPAEAIDEDTMEAIGKPLVFIAPADKRQFISPITTLVHQEIKSNPSLNTSDAENAVKTMLGVDQEDVSLFDDYVAGGLEENDDTREKENFHYLHNTARVVASMMKDIQAEVESAAEAQGMDIAGNKDARQAIKDIVRREVKDLLPSIAFQVTEIARTQAAAASSATEDSDTRPSFNPAKIAIDLRPVDVASNVQEKIEAVVEREKPINSDIKTLLTEGVYWLELDCYQERDDDDDYQAETSETPGVVYNDDVYQESCSAFYGKVQLNDSGDQLTTYNYYRDNTSGSWIDESQTDDQTSNFVLIDGEWQKMSTSGPQGDIKFLDDGSALISNLEGTMKLKAVSENLDANKVLGHLLRDDNDADWLRAVLPTDFFPAGSKAHTMSVKLSLNPYVMFNTQAYDEDGVISCAQYMDNCNAVGNFSAEGFSPISSLNEVLRAATQSIELTSLHTGIGPAASIKLTIDDESDGSLPTSGTVEWITGYPQYDEATREPDYIEKPTFEPTGAKASPVPTNHCVLSDEATRDQLHVDIEGLIEPADLCTDPTLPPIDYPERYPTDHISVLTSKWSLRVVDGVQMIEFSVPNRLRFDDGDIVQSFLLIEHDGMVRLGARQPDSYIDRVVTYNETAFTTLRSIIEYSEIGR